LLKSWVVVVGCVWVANGCRVVFCASCSSFAGND